MIKVIGVRFRTAGKVYFFDPLNLDIKRGDHVIVETARGIEYGTVVSGVHEVEDDKVIQPLKPVLRIATQRDVEQEAANKIKEKEAFKICFEKIRKHELEMKLIDAEYTFDNNKVLFYFTADGRIDFRELVKDLASVFKTRIELRQIGVRDETKILGGIGICGRPLCCHSYLSDFVPVSIKMAKEQNLSLNPTKISGVCGRLMCCLKNEEETYEELNRRLPGIGDFVTTDDGLKGEVQSVNVLRQLVKVVVENGDEKEIRDYEVDRLQFKRKHNKKEKLELSKEEMKELERLEKEELQEDDQAKSESRAENKQERRFERNNAHQNHSEENFGHGEARSNRKFDRRNDRRNDNKNEARNENRNDNRSVNSSEEQTGSEENSTEIRQERRERRNDYRHNRRGDRNGDRKYENHGEAQSENASKNDMVNEAQGNTRADRGQNSQNRENDNRGDGQSNKRYDGKYRRRDRRDRREGRKQENNES